jgi:hypothetical protein
LKKIKEASLEDIANVLGKKSRRKTFITPIILMLEIQFNDLDSIKQQIYWFFRNL